jgi:hypothetical protein
MGKKRNPRAAPAADGADQPAADGPEKSEFSEPVKLREKFKRDLQMVAIGVGIPMGDLLERLSWQYVQTMLQLAGKGQPLQAPPPRPAPE